MNFINGTITDEDKTRFGPSVFKYVRDIVCQLSKPSRWVVVCTKANLGVQKASKKDFHSSFTLPNSPSAQWIRAQAAPEMVVSSDAAIWCVAA